MIRGYIRVSTVDQSVEGQEYGLLRFAAERKWRIDEIVQETASGAKSYKVRKLGAVFRQRGQGATFNIQDRSCQDKSWCGEGVEPRVQGGKNRVLSACRVSAVDL